MELLALHAAVLTVAVLELISLEKLSLSRLVLLILTFEVAELAIKLVQTILEVLNVSMGLLNLAADLVQLVISLGDDTLHGSNSLIIVLKIGTKNAATLMKSFHLLVEVVRDVSEANELAVVCVVNFFLIVAEMLEVLNILAGGEVSGVNRGDLVAQISELVHSGEVISLGDVDGLEEGDLLLFDGIILSLEVVELADEHIDLLAIVTDLDEAVVLEVLLV